MAPIARRAGDKPPRYVWNDIHCQHYLTTKEPGTIYAARVMTIVAIEHPYTIGPIASCTILSTQGVLP